MHAAAQAAPACAVYRRLGVVLHIFLCVIEARLRRHLLVIIFRTATKDGKVVSDPDFGLNVTRFRITCGAMYRE
jgi:hypothetical protein